MNLFHQKHVILTSDRSYLTKFGVCYLKLLLFKTVVLNK